MPFVVDALIGITAGLLLTAPLALLFPLLRDVAAFHLAGYFCVPLVLLYGFGGLMLRNLVASLRRVEPTQGHVLTNAFLGAVAATALVALSSFFWDTWDIAYLGSIVIVTGFVPLPVVLINGVFGRVIRMLVTRQVTLRRSK